MFLAEYPKCSAKNLAQCHFMHHKSHINCPGIQHDPSRWQASNMTLSGSVSVIGLSSTLTLCLQI